MNSSPLIRLNFCFCALFRQRAFLLRSLRSGSLSRRDNEPFRRRYGGCPLMPTVADETIDEAGLPFLSGMLAEITWILACTDSSPKKPS